MLFVYILPYHKYNYNTFFIFLLKLTIIRKSTDMIQKLWMPLPQQQFLHLIPLLSTVRLRCRFCETMEMMNAIVYIMVLGAILLGLVVLYNLGVLSFVEKTREVATLKVLGFESGKIRRILQKQNIWLTVIGIITGLYAGWGMLYIICTTVSETLDMFPFLYFPTYVYTIVGTFMVSVTVNFMFSGKVKTIDMVDALKGVE